MKKMKYIIWMLCVGGALFADAKPKTAQRLPDPAKFPRYKTDGTVPKYKGESLSLIHI